MSGSYDAGLVAVFTTQFTANLQMLLQQTGSKLRGKTDEGAHTGKMASPINQIAPIQMKAPAGRFAPKNEINNTFVRRWVFPIPAEGDQLIDSFDELQTIVDPKSQYVSSAAAACGRFWDDQILAACTAQAQIGEDAGSLAAETFNTAATTAGGFQVSASFQADSAVGLTVSKLLEIKRVFTHYHNDLDADPATIIIGSQQEQDLLQQSQVVSREFNDTPVLVDGKLKRFLGFDIVVMERVPQTTLNTTRGCLAFVKTGMYLGIWRDITNNITKRNELSGEPWDVYTQVMSGATRTQPGKVLQILCADTTGADINP